MFLYFWIAIKSVNMTLEWPKMTWSRVLWQVWRWKHDSIYQWINRYRSMNDQWINEVDPNWIYPYREGSQILHFECIYFNNNLTIIILNRPGWGHWGGLVLGKIILRFGQSLLFQYQTSPLRFFHFEFSNLLLKRTFIFKNFVEAQEIWLQIYDSCDMIHVIWRQQCSIRW